MRYSLNEVESCAKRAGRGLGLSWGLAEEAGKATRWLVERGFAGVDFLADYMQTIDGQAASARQPKILDGRWDCESGKLCPIAAGASLNDHAMLVSRGQAIQFGAIHFPLLLVPFASGTAKRCRKSIELSGQGFLFRSAPDGEVVELSFSQDAYRGIEALKCKAISDVTDVVHRSPSVQVDPKSWQVLEKIGHRCYAPNTEESRNSGAGAGLLDNE